MEDPLGSSSSTTTGTTTSSSSSISRAWPSRGRPFCSGSFGGTGPSALSCSMSCATLTIGSSTSYLPCARVVLHLARAGPGRRAAQHKKHKEGDKPNPRDGPCEYLKVVVKQLSSRDPRRSKRKRLWSDASRAPRPVPDRAEEECEEGSSLLAPPSVYT